jgi:hypothetical protein
VRGTSEFAALRQHIWESLKVEVLKNPQFAGLAI